MGMGQWGGAEFLTKGCTKELSGVILMFYFLVGI